ncbi:cobalamin biosynthesis protein [Hoyosella sp. YIM 151337]|uniref:cobalamin biosynthesis protein n=1 Tax=Hoyosella sp. YIM 151337 TaxID=2992742 RepID=UPI002235C2CA|nr:cobalamin biosynthesis protein [Hoyosella sp. YIM 151337]MCW4355341.1 cobalamin biosynthesis protein [Hoyosella sp. YIM 151337]
MAVRAAGIALGYTADRLLGDPREYHPVAGFGRCAAALERAIYRDRRAAGIVYTTVLAGGALGAAVLLDRRVSAAALPRAVLLGAATWAALGGTSLTRVGHRMADRLESGDVLGARDVLPSLCGRDAELLDSDGLARAAVESVAENTSDAAIGPLVYALVLGTPGVVMYRAVNTLDAIVGYKSPRYLRFGWASARLDDLLNLLPARVSAAATVAAAPLIGGDRVATLTVWRRDAAAHPSPNAGVAEASMAGALGVRLGGLTEYRHGPEQRPVLGSGPQPSVADLRRAVRLSGRVQDLVAAAAVSAALAVAVRKFVLR